jgi:hypothetical protein
MKMTWITNIHIRNKLVQKKKSKAKTLHLTEIVLKQHLLV